MSASEATRRRSGDGRGAVSREAENLTLEPVRLRRIQQFLLTHFVLCCIALVALIGEATLVTDRSHVVTSLATAIVPLAPISAAGA